MRGEGRWRPAPVLRSVRHVRRCSVGQAGRERDSRAGERLRDLRRLSPRIAAPQHRERDHRASRGRQTVAFCLDDERSGEGPRRACLCVAKDGRGIGPRQRNLQRVSPRRQGAAVLLRALVTVDAPLDCDGVYRLLQDAARLKHDAKLVWCPGAEPTALRLERGRGRIPCHRLKRQAGVVELQGERSSRDVPELQGDVRFQPR